MIAYLDSSVILRLVLDQPGQLTEMSSIILGVASQLAEVECLRTLDRLRVLGQLSVDEGARAREAVYALLREVEIVQLSATVLRRASNPMAAPLGTLDAIHLATADVWREEQRKDPVIATHDRALALAARASGFEVVGL